MSDDEVDSSSQKGKQPETCENIATKLKELYKNVLKPLEEAYQFQNYYSPLLEDGDFNSKPTILFVGQYSTGKTTFIKYLLKQDFPGMRIGPEPTTDCFHAIMAGDKIGRNEAFQGEILGNALVFDKTKPFSAFSNFGNSFLSRLKCSIIKNKFLENISFIDTPGILSGEKQKLKRGYEFIQVMKLFAERADMIILLFDAHKLDISDEFHAIINAMIEHHSKFRVVLNKADQVTTKELMRVYGSLMWSLGKVLNTPEAARVYIGSFWDKPFHCDENKSLFDSEHDDLLDDINQLPMNAAMRKINDFIKRANLAKIHAYIISHLHSQMPFFFNPLQNSKGIKDKLMENLNQIYEDVARKYRLPLGDFPDVEDLREKLKSKSCPGFRSLDTTLVQKVDTMLSKNVSGLTSVWQKESGAFDKHVPETSRKRATSNSSAGSFASSSPVKRSKTSS